MPVLSSDAFLLALKGLFDAAQTKGSVFLTQKWCPGRACSTSSKVSPPCVIYIATDGKTKARRKVSTRIPTNDALRFHAAFMNVVKGNMTLLKKIEKTADAKKAGGGVNKAGVAGSASGVKAVVK